MILPSEDASFACSTAVRLVDLSYRYPDGRHALRHISLEIASGASVALIGPNGAGKSTLLRHLNGLLPGKTGGASGHSHGADGHEIASVSSVWIDGLEATRKNLPEIRRRVGLLFQDPDDQLFATTVLDDVAFGPRNLGKSRSDARRIALDCLEQVGLAETAERLPHHLSYGERKRVCLAGVLACEPSVLVLDEPSANLDPRGRRSFIELIDRLPATKLIATHDLELALELCEETIILDGGQLVAQGPTIEILCQEELLLEHGLEVPLSLKLKR
jgi:energy-coupling factor transporter ATP-binding protein EcfA2